MRGLYSEGLIYGGKFAFQIDWASLIVRSKFTYAFLDISVVFEGNFPSTSPRRGDLTEGFLHYRFGGLIFGGAYFRNLRYLVWINRKETVII